METVKRSFWSNMLFHFRHLRIWNKKLFAVSVLYVLAEAAMGYLNIFLPKLLFSLLEDGADIPKVLLMLGTLIAAIVLARLLYSYANAELDFGRMFYGKYFMMLLNRKMMDIDYELLENERSQPAIQRAFRSFSVGEGSVEGALLYIPRFFADLLGLLLFGASVAVMDVRITALLLLDSAISFTASAFCRKYVESRQGELAEYHKKLNYILRTSGDFNCGKDIRLYRMAGWFKAVYQNLSDEDTNIQQEIRNRWFWGHTVSYAAALATTLIVYGFLLQGILSGRLSVSDFIFYTGLAAGVQWRVRSLILDIGTIYLENDAFRNLRGCLDITNRTNRGEGLSVERYKRDGKAPEIRCENVGFTYPDSDKKVIQRLNLVVKSGEKIGIVGSNGAGKTTLLKLICGLYDCREGSIRIDGQAVERFNRIDYFGLFSAVFQDVEIIPATIAQNVSMCDEKRTDRERVWDCLKKAGLEEKVKRLSGGLDTCLVKSIYEDAADLSGGERQKLLLARALYKDAPVLILDEPTAALDPIAEDEVYRTYRDLSVRKTSFFISHRLASTRFCDRILYLEEGRIEETGTHEELMALKGKYWKMFEVQSRYYKEEGKKDGSSAG